MKEPIRIKEMFETVEFETKNGIIRCYLRDGLLHITANDCIKVMPTASNCINVGVLHDEL